MGIEQRLISQEIEKKEIVTQCMITGYYKVPKTNDWVGYRLTPEQRQYALISHGYCPEEGENALLTYRMLRANNRPLYDDKAI